MSKPAPEPQTRLPRNRRYYKLMEEMTKNDPIIQGIRARYDAMIAPLQNEILKLQAAKGEEIRVRMAEQLVPRASAKAQAQSTKEFLKRLKEERVPLIPVTGTNRFANSQPSTQPTNES